MNSGIMGTIQGLRGVLAPSLPKRGTLIVLVVGFIIGLLWAYGLAPIVFFDADPSSLSESWQREWIKLLADRQAATSADLTESIADLAAEVDNPQAILNDLLNDPGEAANRQKYLAIQAAVQQAQPGTPSPQPNLIGNILPFIIGPIVLVVVGSIVGVVWDLLIYPFMQPRLRRIRSGSKGPAPRGGTKPATPRPPAPKPSAPVLDPTLGEPVLQKMSVYRPDRQYDDSFSIEDKNENFLGECGAGVSETIGGGPEERVTAVEVWLFDKDDFVRTLTNVFASEHAMNDPALLAKLEPKGDNVLLAEVGAITALETSGLKMQARVVEVDYGTAESLPANSFFESLAIEIVIWRKTGETPAAQPTAPSPAAATPGQPPATAPSYTPPTAPTQPPGNYTPPGAPPRPPAPPPRQPAPPSSSPSDDPFGGAGDF